MRKHEEIKYPTILDYYEHRKNDKICYQFRLNRVCLDEYCFHAHSYEELKPRTPFINYFKYPQSTICTSFFHKSDCIYKNCCKAHSLRELKPIPCVFGENCFMVEKKGNYYFCKLKKHIILSQMRESMTKKTKEELDNIKYVIDDRGLDTNIHYLSCQCIHPNESRTNYANRISFA